MIGQFARATGPQDFPLIANVGQYFLPPGADVALAPATLTRPHYLPLVVARSIAVDRVAVEVTTEQTATVVRLGLYASGEGGLPDALVYDWGTADASSTGVKTITIDSILPVGLVWLVAVPQGTANPTLRRWRSILTAPTTSTATIFGNDSSLRGANVVSGALPSTASVEQATLSGVPRIALRRSA